MDGTPKDGPKDAFSTFSVVLTQCPETNKYVTKVNNHKTEVLVNLFLEGGSK